MSDVRFHTFFELLTDVANRFGDKVFLPRRYGRGEDADPVTFRHLRDDVERLACGLLAQGIRRGDRVGLIAENRYEWLLCDLACACIGAIDVPRGTDTAADELTFILRHSGCRFVFAETAAVARELAAMRDRIPDMEDIWVMDRDADTEFGSLDELLARGDDHSPGALDRAAAEVEPDDLLTIVYTSGTTDNPKGVMLTQRNVIANMAMVDAVLDFGATDTFLSVLPAWHAYERIMNYVALGAGSELVYSDRRHIKEDLMSRRPTVFAAVPRIWEMIHDGIHGHARKAQGLQRRVLQFALENARRTGSGKQGPLGRIARAVLNRTVFPRILAATGGRLRIAVSGGGSLPRHVDECLLGLGLPLLNGYGLTETSPVASVRLLGSNRSGTIGPPLPNTRFEIRDHDGDVLPGGDVGLIWIKGPQVMSGYLDNEAGTTQVLRDGWFNSGDLGCVEPDGQIRITGRAKDTIVLAGGENVEPERVEAQLKTSPLIDQAVVLGQDEKTLGAIVIPNIDYLEDQIPRTEWNERDGRIESPKITAYLRREIDRLLAREQGFRPTERVVAFRIILQPLTAENGQLTQTMKVKRHVVHEQHSELIGELFGR